VELTNFTTHADRFLWDLGDGKISEEKSLIYQYEHPGNYTITLYSYGGGVCRDSASIKVHIHDIYVPNVITPNNDSKNDQFKVVTDAPVKLKILNRWGEVVYKSDFYKNDWNGSNLSAGVYYYELMMNNETTCNGWLQLLK
jgi:gliding motility-associated-like protein